MNKRIYVLCSFLLLSIVLPASVHAQDTGLSDDLSGLELTLNNVYNAMITKCSWLITVASGIGGLAAVFYIGNKVWGSIARAEPIDFYPLLRPFALGMCISLFPAVIATFNGILQPTVSGTAAIVTDSKEAVATLLQRKEDALKQSNDWQMYVGPDGSGDIAKWEQLSGEADDGFMSGISNRVKFEMSKMSYNFKNSIKVWLSELLQVLYEAAALCINTVRTFYLIILAILGPLVFAISIFDGLHHILVSWIARYINVFLWLPIANIFSSLINQIQQEMIRLDIQQIQATGQTTFGSTDAAYLVFLLMAIVGYFTVPTIANHIIHPGSAGAHLQKMTNVVGQTGQAAVEAAGTMAAIL